MIGIEFLFRAGRFLGRFIPFKAVGRFASAHRVSFIAIAALALLAGGAFGGWKLRDLAADAQMTAYQMAVERNALEASEKARQIEQARNQLALAEAEARALREQEREIEIREVTREVIRYVQSPDAGLVVLSPDWVRIHNRAAAGSDMPGAPDPAGILDAGPESIADLASWGSIRF